MSSRYFRSLSTEKLSADPYVKIGTDMAIALQESESNGFSEEGRQEFLINHRVDASLRLANALRQRENADRAGTTAITTSEHDQSGYDRAAAQIAESYGKFMGGSDEGHVSVYGKQAVQAAQDFNRRMQGEV